MEKKGVDGFLFGILTKFSYLEEQYLKKTLFYPLVKRGGNSVLK